MLIFAHRGASGQYPENTYAAFDAAVSQAADYIELDITLSADGHWLVLHDDTLDRTTNGTGVAGFTNASQIAQLDAGSWKGRRYAGLSVPMIEDVLTRYRGKIGLNIEIKPFFPITANDLLERALESLLEQLDTLEVTDSTIISSANFYILDLLRRYHAGIRLALVYQRSITEYDPRYVNDRLALWSIHPYYRQLTEGFVNNCHTASMKVIPFTINRAEQFRRVKHLPIDGLITNWPAKAATVFAD